VDVYYIYGGIFLAPLCKIRYSPLGHVGGNYSIISQDGFDLAQIGSTWLVMARPEANICLNMCMLASLGHSPNL